MNAFTRAAAYEAREQRIYKDMAELGAERVVAFGDRIWDAAEGAVAKWRADPHYAPLFARLPKDAGGTIAKACELAACETVLDLLKEARGD